MLRYENNQPESAEAFGLCWNKGTEGDCYACMNANTSKSIPKIIKLIKGKVQL